MFKVSLFLLVVLGCASQPRGELANDLVEGVDLIEGVDGLLEAAHSDDDDKEAGGDALHPGDSACKAPAGKGPWPDHCDWFGDVLTPEQREWYQRNSEPSPKHEKQCEPDVPGYLQPPTWANGTALVSPTFKQKHASSLHCNSDCDIPTFVLNAKCTVTKWQMDMLKTNIESCKGGTWSQTKDPCDGTDPKWRIWQNNMGQNRVQRGNRQLGVVTCPCAHANGKKLTPDEAGAKIAGQITAVDVPTSLTALGKWGKYATREVFMKYTVSTQLMLRCWKSHCSSEAENDMQKGEEEELLVQLGLLDPIAAEEDMQDLWGGGISC